jgi:hypothetical protein
MPLLGFVPAPEVEEWVRRTFIDEAGPLHNPAHEHLQQAELGFLWTDIGNSRGGRNIIGQCEIMPPMAMGKWQRARAEYQIEQWFGHVPDFVITLLAPWCDHADDAAFCAVVEHELYHAAQDRDEYGQPKFGRDGSPKFAIRGHDVEEFVGVVERYGAVATGVSEMVRVANMGPSIGAAAVDMACGTCERRKRA